MIDRVEDYYMVFDVDGTVSAARQRAVESDRSNYPPVQRGTIERVLWETKGESVGKVSRVWTTIRPPFSLFSCSLF